MTEQNQQYSAIATEGNSRTLDFNTYEEYLDSQITQLDLYYLESQDLARQLVELGFKGHGDTLSRDEWEKRKAEQEQNKNYRTRRNETDPSGLGFDLDGFPVLQSLQQMEEDVLSGKLSVIIFIRDYNNKGQEISGYIDYGERLKTEDFRSYFDVKSRKRLLPKSSDLSYYNWESGQLSSNSSSNFEVITDPEEGLIFKNKRDRKVIVTNPTMSPGSFTDSYEIVTHEYEQVVIYEHSTKRKS
ncbi:hypothetical protein PCE1_003146 [Barthelona sp. PCE]